MHPFTSDPAVTEVLQRGLAEAIYRDSLMLPMLQYPMAARPPKPLTPWQRLRAFWYWRCSWLPRRIKGAFLVLFVGRPYDGDF